LLDVALLKGLSHALGIISVTQKGKSALITFKADADVQPESIARLVTENKDKLLFTVAPTPYLTYKIADSETLLFVKNLIDLVKKI
ncbi:MAG: hypothetical protein LBU77_04155, partial [Clostridiales bacterium]|nr:hypothetical protein [Clostridiales bacterium]